MSSTATPRTAKRRGRPRSPIFNYYRRLTDDKGDFVGNECHFCSFVSRDKSENPTYLTRHILRSCNAPQHIKDAMSVRNTSIVLSTPSNFHQKVDDKPHNPQLQQQPHQQLASQVASQQVASQQVASRQVASQQVASQQVASQQVASQQVASQQQVASSPTPPPHPPPPPPPPPQSHHQAPPPQPSQPPQPPTQPPQPTHVAASQPPTAIAQSHLPIPLRPQPPLTKSRRGRPRSPALQHFRRHTDEKGAFLANKCMHCQFVSRDRSENSTLLLRHLLSAGCEAPEDVRTALRAAKGTNKTRKKPVRVKKDSESGLSLPLLRFCLAHGLDLATVESPYMRDLVEAIRGHASPVNGGVAVIKTDGLPHFADLDVALKEVALSALIIDSGKITFSGSTQLIVHFPNIPEIKKHKLLAGYDLANGLNRHSSGSYIASAFLATGGRQLRYVCSKNCQSNFAAGLADIVQEAMREASVKIDQVMVARPLVDIEKIGGIPKSSAEQDWVFDIARELEILCQELLAKVPLFVKCRRRNKLLASFFKEDYSERTALLLFGRSIAEKEQCQRYLAHIANFPESPSCCHIVEDVLQTFKILHQSQTSHDDPQRIGEVGTFAQSITEEHCGNRQVCQEIIRLLLSPQFRKDLKAFLSIMTPLSTLILRYSNGDAADGMPLKGKNTLEEPLQTTTRSISHVLPDFMRTLCDLYALKLPEYDSDVRFVRDHAAIRLIKGDNKFPAVIGDICYIAAFLDPGADLAAMQGMPVSDVWQRVLKFLERHGTQGEGTMDRVMEQLENFQQRHGVFSVPEMFHEASEPSEWWSQHGSVAPELATIALNILSVPTTTFPAIRYVSECNTREEDLHGTERDSLMQKRRSAAWNLKLAMKR